MAPINLSNRPGNSLRTSKANSLARYTKLLTAVEARKVDCVVVYKVDRLSRSLLDFAKLMETFDRCGVSFVSVTQQFNTTSSLGRLTLNILLSFAQFERELSRVAGNSVSWLLCPSPGGEGVETYLSIAPSGR